MKNHQLLSNYLKGDMNENEMDDYTKEIVKDYFQDIKTKDKWKTILKEKYGVKPFDSIDDIPEIKKKKQFPTRFILGTIVSMAACIVILFTVILDKEPNPTASLKSILNDQYASPMQYRNTKGVKDISSLRAKAFNYYNNKKYKLAASNLEKIVDQEIFVEDDHFYLALSYLYGNEAEKASVIFNNLLEREQLQRRDASIWFLAFSLIEVEEYDEAKIYLDKVANWSGNSGKLKKAEQAKELISIIDNL